MRCQSNNLIVMLFAAILAASIAIVLLGKRTAVEADLITIPVLIDVYDGDDPEHPLIDSDIPLELYVKRVLPNEWVPGWDDDSLMAGAVAVRTWVLSPENWRGAPYAVYDGDGGQQYISGSETDPTNAAVDATAGIYMTHGFKVVNAQYRTEVGDPTNPCPAGVGDCPPPGENCPGLMYPWSSPDDYPYLLSIVDPVSAGYTRTQDDCNSVASPNGAASGGLPSMTGVGSKPSTTTTPTSNSNNCIPSPANTTTILISAVPLLPPLPTGR